MEHYRLHKNSFSIDGIPSIASMFRGPDQALVKPVHQDGYYFGKILDEGQIGGSSGKMKQFYLEKSDTMTIKLNSWIFGAAMFLAGVILGCITTRSYFARHCLESLLRDGG